MAKQKLWIDVLGPVIRGALAVRIGDKGAIVRLDRWNPRDFTVLRSFDSESEARAAFKQWQWEVLCQRRLDDAYVDACEAAE